MKQLVSVAGLVVLVVGLIVLVFTLGQVGREEKRLTADLEYRSNLLAESLKEAVEPQFIDRSTQYLQLVVNKFADRERLVGLAVYDNKEALVAASAGLAAEMFGSQGVAANVMDEDEAGGEFVRWEEGKLYIYAAPLHQDQSVVGSLVLIQNASFIDSRLREIWQNNLIRLLVQASLLTLATLLIVRWLIYEPVTGLVKSLELVRTGVIQEARLPRSFFFGPLIREIGLIRQSLTQSRLAASEEARLGLEREGSWTAQRLQELVKDSLQQQALVVVSNREPYIHVKEGREITVQVPASGMVTALEPVMQACGGLWIAAGTGSADKLVVDSQDKVRVPPDEPRYTLKRVWLNPKEETGYYYGLANEGLWPLMHVAHVRPTFRREDWEEYKRVNGKFARTVLREIREIRRPVILVQDFHLALLPQMIKKSRPDSVVGLFWHVPWPNVDVFRVCPWGKEILQGMLGADLIGFQTQLFCNNFIDTVGKELEALIDFERFAVTREGHRSYVKPFPVSVEFTGAKQSDVGKNLSLGIKLPQYLGIGVDRLDYTKGILERFKAIEMLLQAHPDYRGEFVFIQVAAPSRSKILRYQELAKAVEAEAERVNSRFKTGGWRPIVLWKRYLPKEEIRQLYRLAQTCVVTSLDDGMNLVAKEFVAARNDEQGVLVLSQFTGAARELEQALIVNPYDAAGTGEAIHRALQMGKSEQARRMRRLRETVKANNVYRWSADFLKTLDSLD